MPDAPDTKKLAQKEGPEIPPEAEAPKKVGKKKTTRPKKVGKKAAPSKKPTALTRGRAYLRKEMKDSDDDVVPTDKDLKKSRPHIPSGSVIVDYTIGGIPNEHGVPPCPGLPRGRLVNLYGQESAGKTTMMLMAAAKIIESGGTVCYVDWEHSIDLAYSAKLGVDVQDDDHFLLVQPRSLERGLSYIMTMARSGVDLVVIDSVGAAVPQSVLDQKADEEGKMGRIGLAAAIWSTSLAKLKGIIARTGSCVVGISQMRKNINTSGYGGETDLPMGGEAWKFYSELRMRLKRVGTETGMRYSALLHKKDKAAIGMKVLLKIDKSKVSASQGQKSIFYVTFGEGIDDHRGVMEIGLSHRIVKRAGASYTFEMPDGEVIKATGKDAFLAQLKTDEGIWTALYKSVIAKLNATPDIVEPVEEDNFDDLDDYVTGLGE